MMMSVRIEFFPMWQQPKMNDQKSIAYITKMITKAF